MCPLILIAASACMPYYHPHTFHPVVQVYSFGLSEDSATLQTGEYGIDSYGYDEKEQRPLLSKRRDHQHAATASSDSHYDDYSSTDNENDRDADQFAKADDDTVSPSSYEKKRTGSLHEEPLTRQNTEMTDADATISLPV